MKIQTITSILTLTLLLSCGKNANQQNGQLQESPGADSLSLANDPQKRLNIRTDAFSEIDSSGVVMFPLRMGVTEGEKEGYEYKKMPYDNYWNILFYDSKTGEYRTLTDRKMLILHHSQQRGRGYEEGVSQRTHHIFYTVISEDLNNDQLFGEADPHYLFVSDKFGRNFRQLSPSGYNLMNWKFVASSNKVILTACKDSDKNGEFGPSDEVSAFEVEMGKAAEPRVIFSEELQDSLKMLYARDWKRVR